MRIATLAHLAPHTLIFMLQQVPSSIKRNKPMYQIYILYLHVIKMEKIKLVLYFVDVNRPGKQMCFAFFRKYGLKNHMQHEQIDFSLPWRRMTITSALAPTSIPSQTVNFHKFFNTLMILFTFLSHFTSSALIKYTTNHQSVRLNS